jgi:Calcineurin-like phosphoesterase
VKNPIKKSNSHLLASLLLILLPLVWASQTAAQAPFPFISWGDAQDQGANLPVTSNQAVTLNPAFTIFNGDLEDDGFQLAEMNLMVNALNGDSSGSTGNGMFDKTFLVRGNHDDHQSDSATAWQDYLVQANRPPVPGVTNYAGMEANTTYLNYTFDYENARFIGLDVPGTVSAISTAQIDWVDEILTEAETNHPELVHAFIFFHDAIYCIGYHCSCTAANDPACISFSTTNLISVLNRHPIVSATFHGHEHHLAWTHIDSERITGVTHEFEQFVTSPSGTSSHDSSLKPLRVDYAAMINTRGFAGIDVSGTEFTVSFYQNGLMSPVWSKTFTKSGSPPTPSRSLLPLLLSLPASSSPAAPDGPVHGNGQVLISGWHQAGRWPGAGPQPICCSIPSASISTQFSASFPSTTTEDAGRPK